MLMLRSAVDKIRTLWESGSGLQLVKSGIYYSDCRAAESDAGDENSPSELSKKVKNEGRAPGGWKWVGERSAIFITSNRNRICHACSGDGRAGSGGGGGRECCK